MEIGICTTDFSAQPLETLFAKIAGYGFFQVQFDFASIGEEEMPAQIDGSLIERILQSARDHQLDIVAVNGTFNIIDRDQTVRDRGIERFEVLARACRDMKCPILTLCTGTRSIESMWTWHPDNESDQAWQDMMRSMQTLMSIAERHQITLGIETEAANVVSTPERARRLMDAFDSPLLKVILDGANLFHRNTAFPENVRPTLKHAFDVIGHDIILAHGKDIAASSEIRFAAPGKGIIDYDYFLDLLREYGYTAGMVLHGIEDEADIPYCVDLIQAKIAASGL